MVRTFIPEYFEDFGNDIGFFNLGRRRRVFFEVEVANESESYIALTFKVFALVGTNDGTIGGLITSR